MKRFDIYVGVVFIFMIYTIGMLAMYVAYMEGLSSTGNFVIFMVGLVWTIVPIWFIAWSIDN